MYKILYFGGKTSVLCTKTRLLAILTIVFPVFFGFLSTFFAFCEFRKKGIAIKVSFVYNMANAVF